jgi:hypothetical protein
MTRSSNSFHKYNTVKNQYTEGYMHSLKYYPGTRSLEMVFPMVGGLGTRRDRKIFSSTGRTLFLAMGDGYRHLLAEIYVCTVFYVDLCLAELCVYLPVWPGPVSHYSLQRTSFLSSRMEPVVWRRCSLCDSHSLVGGGDGSGFSLWSVPL